MQMLPMYSASTLWKQTLRQLVRRSLCSMNTICSDMAGMENLFHLKQPGYLVVLRKQTSGSLEEDL